MGKERKIFNWEQDFLYTTEDYQQLRGKGLLAMGYHIVLRGRWCNIIVLNGHAPSEEKSDDLKDSFYEKLEQFFLSSYVPYENSSRKF